MGRDTDEELQRLSDALLEEEEQDEQPWEIDVAEEDLFIEDVPEYKNHANNYGNVFNSDRTELAPEDLSDALLEDEEDQTGRGKLLLLAILLLIAIVCVAVYWVVARR